MTPVMSPRSVNCWLCEICISLIQKKHTLRCGNGNRRLTTEFYTKIAGCTTVIFGHRLGTTNIRGRECAGRANTDTGRAPGAIGIECQLRQYLCVDQFPYL